MIDLYSAVVSIIVVYSISFPTGCATIHRIFSPKLSSYPFFVRLPLYIAFGITMLIPMYLVVALIKLTMLTPIAIFLLSIAYVISSKKAWHDRSGTPNEGLIDEILPFIFFIATAMYFLVVANYMKWPPAGDVISGTGPLVSLVEFAGKLPIEPSPILILYPPGFHVLVATFNTLLKLYPAEAVFLISASTITLIPPLLYSLTYITTRSKAFSTIAFFSTFLIHSSGNLEKWVVGYFFNGVYPSLSGFLIIVTFMNILALLNLKSSERDWHKIRKSLMTSFSVSISLIFTYPPFALLTITYVIIILVIYHNLFWQQFKLALRSPNITTKVLTIVVTLILFAFLYSLFSISQVHYIFDVLISYLRGSYFPGGIGIGGKETSSAYAISPFFLVDNVNGASILIAYFVGIYLTLRWKKLDVPLFFLLTATLVFASLNEVIYQFIFYITPTRSVIILSLLAWPLILTTADKIIKTCKLTPTSKVIITILGRKTVIRSHEVILKVVAVVIMVSVFAPSLSGYFSVRQLEAWSWFSHQPWFANDFAALEWINKNVKGTDLIFNDASHASNYLWGLSIKNLTGHPWTQLVYSKRFNDLQRVWQNPRDLEYIIEVLKKYNVRYIFSTSEWGYQLYGSHFGYYPKPYSPEEYAEIFDHYPFLETVFKAGSTRVYKVISSGVELKQLQVYNLESLPASTFWNDSDAWNIGGNVGSPLLSNVEQRIDIPSGNFNCWGIYHYFQNFEEWPREARYISILAYAKFESGLSLLVWDGNGNNARYDFVLSGGNWDRIFLDILNPSEHHGTVDTTKIKGFALVTGFIGPGPRPGNSIYIKYVKVISVG
jgi:hypothetical protein